MSNTRNWTWLETATEEQTEDIANEYAIGAYADRWNYLNAEAEHEHFEALRRAEDYECDCEGPEFDTQEEADTYWAKVRGRREAARDMRDSQLRYLEEQMAARGARMCRPYEHWNEDEARVRMMEGE